MKKVIVITGIGGLGLAIARRIGTGFKLILADCMKEKLETGATALADNGYDVETEILEVSDQHSVENLAAKSSVKGKIHAIIHTAGLSPNMSGPERILEVNLLGTARIIAAFEPYLSFGTVGIMVSSMFAYTAPELDLLAEKRLALLSANDLKAFLISLKIKDSGSAYAVSKKGNILQVQSAAVTWGKKGARLLSISPGIISTPMGLFEMERTPDMDYMIMNSPAKRFGTPEDIAGLVDFLQSPNASFLTGTDILIDGGVIAYLKDNNLA